MKTHLYILWFCLQEECCWGEGLKIQQVFFGSGCFLMFQKSTISSNCFLWQLLGWFYCLHFSPSKDAFPRGLWQDGDIPQRCHKAASGGFLALLFCSLQAALSQRCLWHPAAPGICLSSRVMLLPGCFGNLSAAAGAGFLHITHSVLCLRKNRKPNRRVL